MFLGVPREVDQGETSAAGSAVAHAEPARHHAVGLRGVGAPSFRRRPVPTQITRLTTLVRGTNLR